MQDIKQQLFNSLIISGPIIAAIFAWPLSLLGYYNERAFILVRWLFYQTVIRIFNESMITAKEAIFPQLLSNLSDTNKAPRILEIGAGEGDNFRFFPDGARVTLVDSNPNQLAHAVNNLTSKYPKLHLDGAVLTSAEEMSNQLPENSFDAVVASHVLACLPNKQEACNQIVRILKEDGKYFFIERQPLLFPEDQPLLAAMYAIYMAIFQFVTCGILHGCPKLKKLLKEAQFSKINLKVATISNLPISEMQFGVAIK